MWDSVIDEDALFTQYRRILKPQGTIILTVVFPFGLSLIAKNLDIFKYDLVWKKSRPTNFANAKNRPMRKHENILVFSKGTTANGSKRKMIYNPQGLIEINKEKVCLPSKKSNIGIRNNYIGNVYTQKFTNYPNTIINIPSEEKTVHPTQKPVDLFEWLIKTYSNPGDIVLDNCIGSGTTAIAALTTGRFFIGIEKDEKYYKIAAERINEHKWSLIC